MSRNDDQMTVLTAKEALKNLDKWQIQVPKTNRFTHKKESAILYDGNVVCVQLGTPRQPLYCGTGLSRWSQKDNRFVTVTGDEGSQWAFAAQQDSQFERKTPGGKLQSQLTLHEWDTEKTAGYYAYELIKGVINRIVAGLAHGVPDPAQLDANGVPKIVQVVELPTTANTAEERERLFRFSLTSPLEDSQGTWAPKLKAKIRYSVKNDIVGLEADILNSNDAAGKPAQFGRAQFDLFKERCRGVFVIKFNPLQFKRSEIHFTCDIVTAAIVPSVSMFKGVAVRLDADSDEEMDGAGGVE